MIGTLSLINSTSEPCLQAALSFGMRISVWNYYYSSSSISLYLPASPLPAKPDPSLSLSLPHSVAKHVLIKSTHEPTWPKRLESSFQTDSSSRFIVPCERERVMLCLKRITLVSLSRLGRHEGIKARTGIEGRLGHDPRFIHVRTPRVWGLTRLPPPHSLTAVSAPCADWADRNSEGKKEKERDSGEKQDEWATRTGKKRTIDSKWIIY